MSQTNTNTNNDHNRNQISRRGRRSNGHRNNLIANKYSFEGKMKDNPISKLIITKTGHQPSQYKKIIDTLPILCADKNYQGIDDVIWTRNNLVEQTSCQPIQTPTNGLPPIMWKLEPSTQTKQQQPMAHAPSPTCVRGQF